MIEYVRKLERQKNSVTNLGNILIANQKTNGRIIPFGKYNPKIIMKRNKELWK